MQRAVPLDRDDRAAGSSLRSASTSAARRDLFGRCSSAALVLAMPRDSDRRICRLCARTIAKTRITLMQAHADHCWQTLARRAASQSCRPALARCSCGGEALSRGAPGSLALQRRARCHQSYGPTETTIWSHAMRLRPIVAGRGRRSGGRSRTRGSTCSTAAAAGAGRGGRRALHRRGRAGARLSGPARADRGAVRADPFGAGRARGCTAPAIWRAGGPTATLEFLGRVDHR